MDIPDNLSIYNKNWQTWLEMKKYGPANRWLRSLIADAVHDIEGQVLTILDVGCGEGTNTAFLSERFPHAHVTGIDFSSKGIRMANMYHAHERMNFVLDHDSTILKKHNLT